MNEDFKNAYPKVGVGVMIVKESKVLLHKRKGSHGEGEYAWPGGHLEYMESLEDCVRREVQEEAGIEIKNIRFLRLVNLKSYAPKHYLDIGFVADWASGEPRIMEPEKNDGWEWHEMDALPIPRFKALDTYIEAYKTGRVFWDA
ncbi:MAG: MutT/nudix family protein [Parcubacteria group bacterium Greene1014_15]|nr:MAG: MutT/nudix family protein [Parcubacteria group bacterium Greene1014_15]